jgi:F-type H+-transporting ATPase subunit delta
VSDRSPVSGVSGRYATALFELADESGQLEEAERQVGVVAEALAESADLRRLVDLPIYSRDEQGKAMAAVCDAIGVGAPVKNLIGLMASKRRLFALTDVIRGFNALLAERRGVVFAEVRSAAPLSADQRAALARTLGEATGSEIRLEETVDESLIGGLVVKLGSRMIDTTVRSQLNQLQTAMKEAGI